MKTAIITYDLKVVTSDDNKRVKAALLSFTNTYEGLRGINVFSPFWERVVLKMPDTSITAEVIGSPRPKDIADHVLAIIEAKGATADKVYVAFIEEEYLWNSK